eukprot:3979239-Karenia_brevis.AAC.1
MGPPFQAFKSQLSDHVMVKVSLGIPVVDCTLEVPIPPWICKDPAFKRVLVALNNATDFGATDLVWQLGALKQNIREASKVARDEIHQNSTNFSDDLVLSSVARA